MSTESAKITRFALRQAFAPDIIRKEAEVHRTAVISIIGEAPLDCMERALQTLNYAAGRFRTISHSSTSGEWQQMSDRKMPEYGAGLLLITEESEAALDLLEQEALRYWGAGIEPLVGFPMRLHLASAVKQTMAQHKFQWSLVRFDRASQARSSAVPDRFVESAMMTIEALMLPGVYPGLVCIDSMDISCIYRSSSLRVIALHADSIDELMASVEIEAAAMERPKEILTTLYGPSSLKFSEFNRIMRPLKKKTPRSAVSLIAALSDAKRTNYSLYVVTNE